jgi:transcriptional regulator with XRE-family HTH domain
MLRPDQIAARQEDLPKVGFGYMLRRIRLSRRLGVRQLARMAGLSPMSISALEAGKCEPSGPTAVALADALKLSLDTLFGRKTPQP